MKIGVVCISLAFLTALLCACVSLPTPLPMTHRVVPALPTVPAGTTVNPSGNPSRARLLSAGSIDMYFDCFDGYLYKIASDNQNMVLEYNFSEVSAASIGLDYNPLHPDEDRSAVYGVNGMQNINGLDVPRSIAILDEYSQDLTRADYFMKDTITFNGKTYCIAPVSILGSLDDDSFQPYKTNQKLGKCAEGYDVYSLASPESPGVLAVDIPGMTIDLGAGHDGLGMLYPQAVPQ